MQNPIIIKWNELLIKETFPNINFGDYNKPQHNDIVEISQQLYHNSYNFNVISKVSIERQLKFKSNIYFKSDILTAYNPLPNYTIEHQPFNQWPELINLLKLSTEELLIEISKDDAQS